MNLIKLDWDTSFFEKPVFKCDITNFIEFEMAQSQLPSPALCYFFSKQKISTLDKYLFDEKVIFRLQTNTYTRVQQQTTSVECKTVKEQPIALFSIASLATTSSQHSRFRKDPEIPNKKVDELYLKWVEKAYQQPKNHEIFLAYADRVLAGLISCTVKDDKMTIELVSTLPEFQNRGIGSYLMTAILNFAKGNGIEEIYVTTQLDNTPACRLYKKYGFKVYDNSYVYHYHKDKKN